VTTNAGLLARLMAVGGRVRLLSFRKHGGGPGAWGTVVAYRDDGPFFTMQVPGKGWVKVRRPWFVHFDDCPIAIYRFAEHELEAQP
jgi:hypothetical protein